MRCRFVSSSKVRQGKGARASCPFVVFFNALERDARSFNFRTTAVINSPEYLSEKWNVRRGKGEEDKGSEPQRGCLTGNRRCCCSSKQRGNPVGVEVFLVGYPGHCLELDLVSPSGKMFKRRMGRDAYLKKKKRQTGKDARSPFAP
jgi:hypothetical protein